MGWENGAGFGHVARMRPVARALVKRGHQVVMSLRDLVEPAPMLKDESYPIFQGPYWSRPAPNNPRGRPFSAATFADILAVTGFANADDLSAMLRAWDGVIDIVKPDLIAAEYAPILILAARGRVPTVAFGSGFVMPPADLPVYPRLQPGIEPVMPQEKVLDAVGEAQRRRGYQAPDALPAIFACERRFPCTFPEIDPYRGMRREVVLPPLGDLPPPLPLPPSPQFFAYLAADAPGLSRIVSALANSGIPGGIFLRHPPPRLKDAIRKTGIALFEEPQPLTSVLAEASLIIHHGGAGTTEACLTAGRTQILFPRHLEQWMTAHSLRSLGAGIGIRSDVKEEDLVKTVHHVSGNRPTQEKAAAIAAQIAARGPRPGIAPILAACEELLARSH